MIRNVPVESIINPKLVIFVMRPHLEVIRQSVGPTPDTDYVHADADEYISHSDWSRRENRPKSACSFPSTISSTSSKKMSNFKDRLRNLASKVKGSSTRSRLPSRAPTPVPDHSSVGPTQVGNDEGVSWICCSNNPLIIGLGAPPTSVANAANEGDCSHLPSTPAANRSDRTHRGSARMGWMAS